ncbi:MAG: flagellar hook-basal body complex protein [Zoogloeaceae bacterium]|jgi:flagellar hook protein FlgE|nr:flagellar hook-basal body complex protein [Zoogloeaceae bacterium]
MAFQQGLSGLNVYSKALDVVSNNIANASTVGYKTSQAHFADIYAGTLYGATNKQVGIGVNLMAVQQQFTQGNISITNNPLDIAINGNGFFRVQKSPNDQSAYYTRNGQFHVNKDGYIVNSNGTFLTGYASQDGVTVNPASIVPLTIGTGGIPPQQTGWTSSVYPDQGGLTIGVNLDGRDKKSTTVNGTPIMALQVETTPGAPGVTVAGTAQTPINGTLTYQENTPPGTGGKLLGGPNGAIEYDGASASSSVTLNWNGALITISGTLANGATVNVTTSDAHLNITSRSNPNTEPIILTYNAGQFSGNRPFTTVEVNGTPTPMPITYTSGDTITIDGVSFVISADASNPLKDGDVFTIAPPDLAWERLIPFNWSNTSSPPFDPSMYSFSAPATIYDQSGATHILTNYYVRRGDDGVDARTWDVFTVVDNKYLVSSSSTTPTATLAFNADGTIDLANSSPNTGRVPLDLSSVLQLDGTTVDLTSDLGGYNWFRQTAGSAFNMNLRDSTMFGMKHDVNSIVQDGYAPGTLTSLTVSESGHITGGYSNGKTKIMGQVALVEFKNPEGLQSIGNNMWLESYASGQPTIGEPGAGTRGLLEGGKVEDSNTDLTKELVDMIVFQRNYQANAQTIRTQDQILQTLVNLR